jgi:hypothetical protein
MAEGGEAAAIEAVAGVIMPEAVLIFGAERTAAERTEVAPTVAERTGAALTAVACTGVALTARECTGVASTVAERTGAAFMAGDITAGSGTELGGATGAVGGGPMASAHAGASRR